MAQHKSAEKRARSSARKQVRNAALRSKIKNAVKELRAQKEKAKAQADLRKAVKLLDQLAAKGIIHKNKAANTKSSLTLLVNSLK
jgi:small subunit ribosomal protein S20